ncbi:helix-turn-helix domain-containing protein [Catalinimonas niigatensis]|uniref:helix-turn-helix domain-containing protein n=1 Tax=Catalinimonas niigatensis TaxID=1397264 RepID=UPI002666D55A|nr:helix-turn-helix transcriptional regulator [Catalinimonas niigatensis]WPP48030.1 helix-turn-helix transcriptional regulator [Catalinimonas niigatensis]
MKNKQDIPLKAKIETHQWIKVSRMKEVIKPTRPHKHDGYFEIILLREGAGFHTIDDAAYEVLTPLVHLLKPGQVHCWDFTQIPKGYVLMFKEEVLQNYSAARTKLYELQPEIRLRDIHELSALFEQSLQAYQSDRNSDEMLYAYLNLIILKLSQHSNDLTLSNPTTLSLLYTYKKLVNQRFADLKLVSEYAEALHSSTARLNEACQTALGKNASTIIKERIVLEAKNLLFHTNKTVTEIATDLRFSDASNFVRFFKSHTGLTPHKYRDLI